MIIEKLITQYPKLKGIEGEILSFIDILEKRIFQGSKLLLCGNGGSAADAEHIVGELMKSFMIKRPLDINIKEKLLETYSYQCSGMVEKLEQPISAISLVSGVSLSTAYANDVDSEYIFAQQVLGLGKKNDVLWGISTSGNSKNIVHAFRLAKVMGLTTLALTGRDGGEMGKLADYEIRVPAFSTPEIQELHLPIYHAICAELEYRFFGEKIKKNIKDLSKIELIVFDFDGIFTDNNVYIAQDGTESVRCSRADSLGLSLLKKIHGPDCCILSTEENPVVTTRAKKLGITCYQGCSDKKKFLQEKLNEKGIALEKVLYMGNDLNDLEVMSVVGMTVAPSDAHSKIKERADIVITMSGGNGAIRELCELFIKIKE